MKDYFRLLPTSRLTQRALDLAKRAIALTLVWLIIPLGVAPLASAQEAPPPPPDQAGPPPDQAGPDQGPPPQQWNALSPEQLQQLVAPIALYPDALVAQVLAAATYPTQIVDADRFVESRQGYPPDQLAQMVDQQPWDPSVKAVAAFPSVLSNMDRNLDWATQLGNAYYNQPQDVMTAVQTDRQEAYASGHLRTTPQEVVYYQPGDIVISPYNPAVVYVPYYNPWTIWGWGHPYYAWYAPPPPRGLVFAAGLAIGFGIGIAIGAWGHYGWGWGHWGFAWGPHPYIMHDHAMFVSRSVTVFNHGHYGYFDRHPGAREFNAHVAASAYAHGYAAGAHNGYNRGYNHGLNRGAQAGYNHGYSHGSQAGYNHGFNNGYNRGAASTQHAPAGNFNRSQESRPGNFSRPQESHSQNFSRPASRPQESHGGQPHAEASHESHGGGGHESHSSGHEPHGGGHESHGHR